eukprot:38264-Pelagomonas_calceolata.AAC.1
MTEGEQHPQQQQQQQQQQPEQQNGDPSAMPSPTQDGQKPGSDKLSPSSTTITAGIGLDRPSVADSTASAGGGGQFGTCAHGKCRVGRETDDLACEWNIKHLLSVCGTQPIVQFLWWTIKRGPIRCVRGLKGVGCKREEVQEVQHSKLVKWGEIASRIRAAQRAYPSDAISNGPFVVGLISGMGVTDGCNPCVCTDLHAGRSDPGARPSPDCRDHELHDGGLQRGKPRSLRGTPGSSGQRREGEDGPAASRAAREGQRGAGKPSRVQAQPQQQHQALVAESGFHQHQPRAPTGRQ